MYEWVGDAILTAYLRLILKTSYPVASYSILHSVVSYVACNKNLNHFIEVEGEDDVRNSDEVEAKIGRLFLIEPGAARDYVKRILEASDVPFETLELICEFEKVGDAASKDYFQFKLMFGLGQIGEVIYRREKEKYEKILKKRLTRRAGDIK